MNRADVERNTIIMGLVGSRAYGIALEDSDYDYRGVCIGKFDHYFGQAIFEQKDNGWNVEPRCDNPRSSAISDAIDEAGDCSIYEVKKFLHLAMMNNPNILEMLFLDNYVFVDKLGEKILAKRDEFISKRCKHTYAGYGYSQLKKIETHRGWLLNPIDRQPELADFGLNENNRLNKSETGAFLEFVYSLVKDKINHLEVDYKLRELLQQEIDLKSCLKQFDLTDEQLAYVADKVGVSNQFISLLHATQLYNKAMDNYQSYQKWKANRNPKRAELEAKIGYDCYSYDTEFLTDKGWKLFDDITDESLATVYIGPDLTVRKWGRLEYQKPIDKFSGLFSGNLYHLSGHDLDILVTPNHNMYYDVPVHKDGYVEAYTGWELGQVATMPCKNLKFLTCVTPTKATCFKGQSNFDGLPVSHKDFLRLMGWYLSDGCVAFKNGIPKAIRISQKLDGKLYKEMVRFNQTYPGLSSLHQYTREPNEFNSGYCEETILIVTNKSIVNKIYNDCGYITAKHIPRWVFDLPSNYLEFLVEGLMLGDGHVKANVEQHGEVYYTSSKILADGVQEVLFNCGWLTKIYGPYQYRDDKYLPMYQVVFNRLHAQTTTYCKDKNLKLVPVENHWVVCFTVPNKMLVTRRNGKIAIQGNSKHGAHALRLLTISGEVLDGKGLIVNREVAGDAEYLRYLRLGNVQYEDMMEQATKLIDSLDVKYDASTLRWNVDSKMVNELSIGVIKSHLFQ